MIRQKLGALSAATVAMLAIAGCSPVLITVASEQPAMASIATVAADIAPSFWRIKRHPTARGTGSAT